MTGPPKERMRFAFWAIVASMFVIACFVVVRHSAARGEPELVWGERGTQPGDFVRPRAIAIDSKDRLFIVDFTARIQVYDRNGVFSGHSWTTPGLP